DDVAEDEDPEAVGDDDAGRRRAAAAMAARERGRSCRGDRIDCGHRHAGCLRLMRARSSCAISAAESSCSRSSLQPNTSIAMAAPKTARIAIHQICQISAKPAAEAKNAITIPIGLLRGISIVSYIGWTCVSPRRFSSQKASIVSTRGSTAKL